MSNFDESKHERDGSGQFASKEHGSVDVDLDAVGLDGETIGTAERIDNPMSNELHGHLATALENNAFKVFNRDADEPDPTVLSMIGMTEDAAYDKYGERSSRWLSCVRITGDVDEIIEGDLEDGDLDGWDTTQTIGHIDLTYVDPISGEEAEVSSFGWDSNSTDWMLDIDTDAACPFNQDGDLRDGEVLPAQFTEDGQDALADYIANGCDTDEAGRWRAEQIEAWETEVWKQQGYGVARAAELRNEIIGHTLWSGHSDERPKLSPEARHAQKSLIDHKEMMSRRAENVRRMRDERRAQKEAENRR